jgi:hypothetical protein
VITEVLHRHVRLRVPDGEIHVAVALLLQPQLRGCPQEPLAHRQHAVQPHGDMVEPLAGLRACQANALDGQESGRLVP